MNEEARRQQLERQEPKAGEFPLERSESGNSPAARPEEGGSPAPGGPPETEGTSHVEHMLNVDPTVPSAQSEPVQSPADEIGSDASDDAAVDATEPIDPSDLSLWEDPVPPNLTARRRGKTYSKPRPVMPISPQQKLLLLDTWQRSGLPAREFAALVNVSRHTLYAWKRRFEQLGPAGLMDQPRGSRRGSRLPELTKRTILMLKQAHPEWGCQRISDMLVRGPALPASPAAVARVLRDAGYESQEQPTRPHPQPAQRFERAKPNQLWQTDLFTFMLKRQNRRVYLVAFMDDHSRFITGYGLHASQSSALVLEVLRAALASYGVPAEILTDNGTQYVTWRGKSQFTRELEKRGIKQIVARPRRPQTLGKIERFWGTMWRECIETSVFVDLADARTRIGLFIDYYNLQRPHQGIEGLVPADRFFHAAPQVLKTLKERVATNALELARNGVPKQPFYLTGQLDGKPFSVHREGDRVVLRRAGEDREEIDFVSPPSEHGQQAHDARHDEQSLPEPLSVDGSPVSAWDTPDAELPPGCSPLDGDVDHSDDATAPEGQHDADVRRASESASPDQRGQSELNEPQQNSDSDEHRQEGGDA